MMIYLIIGIFTAGIVVVIILVTKIANSVNQQLDSVTHALQDTHKTVGDRLDSATKVFGDVQKSLGRLEETHKQIYEISKDISSLQNLLRAPKFRGEIGETLLGKLLEDILPKENIKLQYRFKSGDIVDAAIVVGGNLIAIDAKFPLENFKKTQEVSSEDEKKSAYRSFVRDVKNRIEEVTSKYILPDEGTFDFALMYIPAEAIYYQISQDDDLGDFSKMRKVIFVSPNTFYAYLQAILYGLRGVNIQRNVAKILSDLGRLHIDFKKFKEDFDLVGGHLAKAANKYNDAKEKLGTFNDKLSSTTQSKPRLEKS
ncbi:MAG: DNA recombination protein RmuC [Candidatus Omnitrophica bacterium]|nr:DNA recombination protein RmuC [Candidatus Omnitrophota bacterium]